MVAKSPSPSVAFSLHEEPEDEEVSTPMSSHEKKLVASNIVIKTTDGSVFDEENIMRDFKLDRVDDWSFPVFEVADLYPNTILSRVSKILLKLL